MQELTVKQKLTNYCYFIIFNCIVVVFIASAYWSHESIHCYVLPSKLSDWISICYIATTHFISLTILVAIIGVIALPTIYLTNKKFLIVQSIFASVFIGILIFDVGVFHSDSIHLINININQAIINLKGYIFRTNRIVAYVGFIIYIISIYQINKLINESNWFANNKIGSKFIISVLTSIMISQLIYLTSSHQCKQQLLAYVQYLPININGNNRIKQKIASNYKYINTGKLQYPLKPLQTTKITNPPNILIIAMDAWRADCFNEKDSPNLFDFAKQGKIFSKHFSASNHTITGLFGLFYSIPPSYYYNLLCQQQSSVLFTRLKQLQYQLGFFSEGDNNKILQIITGEKNPTIINNPDINQANSTCDEQLTNNWIKWYSKLDKTKPWFSFVFYDSLHGSLDLPDNYSNSRQLAIGMPYKEIAKKVGKQGFITSYKTCVHYIDSLANQILIKLKKFNDLENTIIIITADHGCEIDDCNQGQWGYGSNFTKFQIQVPLAIILPKNYKSNIFNSKYNFTSHYDIVPTLMQNFLGVANNITDYSIGNDLLNINKIQNYSLVTSLGPYGTYTKTAIIENDKILKIIPNGNYNLIDNLNCLLFNKTIKIKYLNKALEMMTRFIKK